MSLKREALQILADASGPLSSRAIFEKSKDAGDLGGVVVLMSTMKGELVEIAGQERSDGGRPQNLWKLTAAGRQWLTDHAEGVEKPRGGGAPYPAQAPRERRAPRKAQQRSAQSAA